MTTLELDGRPQSAASLPGGTRTDRAERLHPSAPALTVAGLTVVPVLDGERPLGVYVVTDRARWYPVGRPKARTLLGPALAAAVAAAVAVVVTSATRAARPVRHITMGPGGWVSFRGTEPPRRLGVTRQSQTRTRRGSGARTGR